MNINPTKKTDELACEIFNKLLELRASNKRVIKIDFDSSVTSYFSSPVNDETIYFYVCSFKTSGELKSHLNEILKNIPDSIITKICELALLLKENNTEQDADLSALIYTLY